MKQEIENILKNLNTNQKNAIQVEENAVIAAGAGSGKTKVLASRFIYFIVEKGIDIENILALTFTDKAATEMNKRIYNDLKKLKDTNAQKAVENFHKSKISTLDSFCNSIARLACKQFGISPDFSIDDDASYQLAQELSLDFFLEHRANKTMQFFLADNSIENFVENLFVRFLTNFVFISKPIDLQLGLTKQAEKIKKLEKQYFEECHSILKYLQTSDDEGNFTIDNQNLIDKFEIENPFPKNITDKQFFPFLQLLQDITKSRKKAKEYNATELKNDLKQLHQNFLNIYNFEYSKKELSNFFDLLNNLQNEFIKQKKQIGILTFGDVSHLAVEALTSNIDLRNFYKKNIDLIMIDEFQDNNSLQRDLLFLISENMDRNELTVPYPNELLPNKLFFVGDEKQSIYGFRGADVSVFRLLAKQITTEEKIEQTRLGINYRTEPALIDLFNVIFSKVFSTKKDFTEADCIEEEDNINFVPLYEAEYSNVGTREPTAEVNSKIEIMLFDKKRLAYIENKNNYLTAVENEAYALAKKILELYNNKFKIKKDDKAIACSWSDFAILMRTSGKQGIYERIFRQMGIPYKSVQQKGLFIDAPLNDLYAMLKLLIYPSDKKTYAQVLHSPFVNIDDNAFASLLLNFNEPFDIKLAENLDIENKEAYKNACEIYSSLKEKTLELNSTELISYLWYDQAYRYLLLTNFDNTRYLELYDYFFELARQADLDGLSLSQFVDSLSGYIEDGEKLDDMEIPLEQAQNAVSFMTVHKSKGLEFPIVCVPDCSNRSFSTRKEGLVFYDEDLGIVLHSPQAPNLAPQQNLFFENLRNEANAKLIAETKRLLYVAATRAESYLIMTASERFLLLDEDLEDKFLNNQRSLSEIKSLINISETQRSFFDLLLPTLPDENSNIIFTEILPQKKSILFSQKNKLNFNIENKIDFEKIYHQAKIKEFPLAEKTTVAATALGQKDYAIKATEEKIISKNQLKTELEFFVNKNDNLNNEEFSATQLGTLAHEAIEARFLNNEFTYPPKIEKKIKPWVDNFFNSDMYKLAKKAKKLKTEYSFLTKYEGQIVSGQIDLVFTIDDTIYIIDYKTDEFEHPEHHKTQLAIYKKAITDLTKTRGNYQVVKTFLFYLKTGNCVEL